MGPVSLTNVTFLRGVVIRMIVICPPGPFKLNVTDSSVRLDLALQTTSLLHMRPSHR